MKRISLKESPVGMMRQATQVAQVSHLRVHLGADPLEQTLFQANNSDIDNQQLFMIS